MNTIWILTIEVKVWYHDTETAQKIKFSWFFNIYFVDATDPSNLELAFVKKNVLQSNLYKMPKNSLV